MIIMISAIIESNLPIFIMVAMLSVLLFAVGIYWILKNEKSNSNVAISEDLLPIAGDDVISTQLDLARAYIETNNKHLAKPILQLVLEQGSKLQITEAKELLILI